MIGKATIAVLLATYNGEKFLKQQLDSIFSQTYSDFIIYVSDDMSTDQTINILMFYHKKYPNQFVYSVNKKNIGVVKNFEKLIINCKEDYIALCDQDDIWLENKLEIQLKELMLLEKKFVNDPCLVHSDLTMVNKDNSMIYQSFFNFRKINLPNKKSINKIVSHNGIMGCTVLFNKSLQRKILPFPEFLDVHDYWIAIVNETIGHRITLNEKLVLYRIHDNNTSNSSNKIINKKNNLFKMYFNIDPLPFIGLKREYVLKYLLVKFNFLEEKDKRIIKEFICYLENCTNAISLMYKLVSYNLIREDLAYRLKIFIKLMQRSIKNKKDICNIQPQNC